MKKPLFVVPLVLAGFTNVQSAGAQRIDAPVPLDSVATHARLVLAISEFQAEWQRSWRESERLRRNASVQTYVDRRMIYQHCDIPKERAIRMLRDTQYPAIQSRFSTFGFCPTWLLAPRLLSPGEETKWRDSALLERFRPGIAKQRASLLATLASAHVTNRGDMWLIGQYVRFLLDQGEADSAMRVVSGCVDQQWWCSALLGLASSRRGSFRGAESAFGRMRNQMPDSVRCAWDNIRVLLPADEQAIYNNTSCGTQRDSVNSIFWWLSDPQWRVSGNTRALEQDERRTEIALREQAIHDERYAFNEEMGGDALAETIWRYGWPSYTAWGGPWLDLGHSLTYMDFHRAPRAPPYTSFEYALGRVHPVPTLHAVLSPFEAQPDDWDLSSWLPSGAANERWWPVEHFAPTHPIAQFPEGQTALLRRQDFIEVATALRVEHAAFKKERSFDVLLVRSPTPDVIDSLDQQTAHPGQSLVTRALMASTPAVLSIEALGTTIDARTRFGVIPPPTLAAMKPGEIAISQPVLIDGSGGEASLQHPTLALLDHMLPTVTLEGSTRVVGLYWETYGLASTDSAVVSIRLTMNEPASGRRLFGRRRRDSAVSLKWAEGNGQRLLTTLHGPVPIQLRTMLLNFRGLAPGSYILQVELTAPRKHQTVTNQRQIEVR